MLKGIGVYLGRHHLALLALFVALGGTSLAASNALLPRNSVGTAQLKKNSVSAAKLRNGAVTKAKIDKSTLVALKGNKGAQGVPGPQGAQGPAGSPDTPAQVLGKLVQVDGAGSGLDADKLDGLSSANFLKVGSAAGGGLTGTYPNPAIAADSISGANIV